MGHSIYLQLATLLVGADLRREERQWQRNVRRHAFELPFNSQHLLKDIGLESDGRAIGVSVPDSIKAERHIRHLRRVLSMRITT